MKPIDFARAAADAEIQRAAEAAARAQAPAPKPVIAIDGPFTVDTPASIPSNSTELERPTLTLGAINERLAPIRINGVGLEQFGIRGVKEKRALLFTESQFGALVLALQKHLRAVEVAS